MFLIKLSNTPLKPRLIGLFLLLGIVPLVVSGLISLRQSQQLLDEVRQASSQALHEEVAAKLSALRDEKGASIEQYFNTIRDQMLTFSEDRMVVDAMRNARSAFPTYRQEAAIDDATLQAMKQELASYYHGEFSQEFRRRNNGKSINVDTLLQPLDADSVALQYAYIRNNEHPLGSKEQLDRDAAGTAYNELHGAIHPVIRNYLEKFGYYDIFLCDPETGDIVYSVFKELDYSTSLIDGPYAQTNFARAFRKASAATEKDFVVLEDFQPYGPSYKDPASFIASPIFDGDEKVGVAVFQMPLDRITKVMSQRAGLGEKGEAYLIGPDQLMRSDTYLDPKFHSVVGSYRNPAQGKITTEQARLALGGEIGVKETSNYQDCPVIAAYRPVEICGITWGLLAEIPKDEALALVGQLDQLAAAGERNLAISVGWTLLAAAVVITVIALYVARSIANPVTETVQMLEEVADGDLTQRLDINTRDEIGRMAIAVNTAVAASEQTLIQVKEAAEREQAIQAEQAAAEQKRQEQEANVARQRAAEEKQRAEQDRRRADLVQKHVNHMLDVLQRVQQGDYSTPIAIEENDAIGQLASGLQDFFSAKRRSEERERERAESERQQSTEKLRAAEQLQAKVNEILEVVSAAAQGDLSKSVDIHGDEAIDELAAGINRMLADLSNVVADVKLGSSQLTESSQCIAESAQCLATDAQVQSDTVDQMSSAVDELTQSIGTIKEDALSARDVALSTTEMAEAGENSVRKANKAMEELKASSSEIGEIIQLISEIAGQTHMLALNAAIEAARAGEHGLGFAVVADEVTKLAERSNKAAGEIAKLIGESTKKIDEGVELSFGTSETLSQIAEAVRDTAGRISGIADATVHQSSSVSSVSESIQGVSNVSERAAASSEQLASSAEQLGAHAETLNQLVDRFQIETLTKRESPRLKTIA